MKNHILNTVKKGIFAAALFSFVYVPAQLVDLTATVTDAPVVSGENFTISINADATGVDVAGQQIRLTYDQNLMSFVSVDITTDPGDTGSTLSILQVDSSTPGVLFFATIAPLGTSITGTYTAGLVTFEATTPTETPTTIDFVVAGQMDTIVGEFGTGNDVTGNVTGVSFTIEEPLSTPKNQAGVNFSVYPNPSNTKMTFKMFNTSDLIRKISLVDMNGRLIDSAKLETGLGEYTLHVNKYAKGIYIANVETTSGKTGQEKIIIE